MLFGTRSLDSAKRNMPSIDQYIVEGISIVSRAVSAMTTAKSNAGTMVLIGTNQPTSVISAYGNIDVSASNLRSKTGACAPISEYEHLAPV